MGNYSGWEVSGALRTAALGKLSSDVSLGKRPRAAEWETNLLLKFPGAGRTKTPPCEGGV